MIQMFKRLLDFSGTERKRLILSFIFHMCNSVFEMLPIMAVLTVLNGILLSLSNGYMPVKTIWAALGIMLLSISGRILFTNFSAVKRTLGSFSMCSKWRMELGKKLKRVPMGYFNVMEAVAGGFIHAVVIGIWLLFYEWKIGVLMFIGLFLSLCVYAKTQKAGMKYSPRRQAAQAGLVTGILEYIQGMSVVKAFGLADRSDKSVDAAHERRNNSRKVSAPYCRKLYDLYDRGACRKYGCRCKSCGCFLRQIGNNIRYAAS